MTMETHRKNSMEKTGYIRKSGPGNSVFMMEMIMVVFFFALSVSVCISMFVKADSMSRLAADINKAVTKAETIGEIFKAGELEHYRNYPETERGKVRKTDSYLFGWDGILPRHPSRRGGLPEQIGRIFRLITEA